MADNEQLSRSDRIRQKGFDMFGRNQLYRTMDDEMIEAPLDYRKIKVGIKNIQDAVLDLGTLKKGIPQINYVSKGAVQSAIALHDVDTMRAISNFFYNMSGIYQKICNYTAFLYRYDWYLASQIYDDKEKINKDKFMKDFHQILDFLDGTYIKKICGKIALAVIRDGCYYGYMLTNGNGLMLQDLPQKYCRCRYNVAGNIPAIEFDMRFFDQQFQDTDYRMKVLKLFPEEFQKGYVLYKQGKLPGDRPYFNSLDSNSWYLLEPGAAVHFDFNGSETPLFINSIPALIDLDAAQDLDRRKQMQQLLKIIVQTLPLDKNGELLFDVDEAEQIHNNAVEMLSRAIGVDILTTFTDVKSVDISDKNTTDSSSNYVTNAKNAAFDQFGVSTNVFNTSGNLSLEKSMLTDESQVRNLLFQFQIFFDSIVQKLNKNTKHWKFRFYFLETTQNNYKDISKLYKEHAQLGYSKLLPQIALGQSQSFILNSMSFENDILELSTKMIPPLMSSTMSSQDILGTRNQSSSDTTQINQTQENKSTSDSGTGRPEKDDSEKSDKTIKNRESMS